MRPRIGLVQAVLLLALAQALLQACLLLATTARALLAHEPRAVAAGVVAGEPFLLGLAQLLALAPVIALGARLAWPDDPSALAAHALRPVPARALGLSLVAGFALQFPLVELANVLSELVPALARDAAREALLRDATRIDGPYRALAVPFSVVLVAPLTEELLFRGVLQPALAVRLGRLGAIGTVALLFGLFHLEPLAVLYASLAGLVLGALALRARSILASMALHAGFNAAPIVLPEVLVPIPGFNTGDAHAHLPVGWLLSGALGALAALALAARALPDDAPDAAEPP